VIARRCLFPLERKGFNRFFAIWYRMDGEWRYVHPFCPRNLNVLNTDEAENSAQIRLDPSQSFQGPSLRLRKATELPSSPWQVPQSLQWHSGRFCPNAQCGRFKLLAKTV